MKTIIGSILSGPGLIALIVSVQNASALVWIISSLVVFFVGLGLLIDDRADKLKKEIMEEIEELIEERITHRRA